MSMLACFTLGFTFAGVIVPAQTLMQQETPPALMGRISSTMMSVILFAQLVGLALSGILAQAVGVRAVFFLCAALAWLLTGAGRLLLATDRHASAL
jgi:MFS transporter, DHA3 family, macrolide efflux protein